MNNIMVTDIQKALGKKKVNDTKVFFLKYLNTQIETSIPREDLSVRFI